MSDADELAQRPPITSLTKPQRRVLGTLVEKAITVPESYPLTLKSLTSGCNQKSNRDPVTNYSEDDVEDTVSELREMGLAAVVHTESGRTERFRHYFRQHIADLSEPQVAILTELLLRGRQPTGDLRARSSRMAPAGTLDSLEQLRLELSGLQARKLIQADGPLDRRGVEIDHNLYEPREARTMAQRTFEDETPTEVIPNPFSTSAPPAAAPRSAATASITAPAPTQVTVALEARLAAVEVVNQELRTDLAGVRSELAQLKDDLRHLRDALGA